MIDLRAQWWGSWLSPLLTLALALAVAELGGFLVRRDGARRLETLRYKHWGKQSQLSAGTEATAGIFQRTLLLLSTLAALSFRVDDDALRGMLIAGGCLAAAVMLAFALRERKMRGERLFQSPVLRAFALALALSISIGVIVQLTLDHVLNAHVQVH